MGNLLRLLSRDTPKRDEIHHVFVDFENCQPTDAERPMWTRVEGVLSEGQHILHELQQYRGAAEEIRKAISSPKDEDLQEKAWHAVLPLVSQLKKYYEFSLKLENNVPILLEALCSKDLTPNQHLETQQALFKQFAVILDFVLKFDDLKMTNPVMQNDFSYYRRTQSRKRMANEFMKNSLGLKFTFKENADGEEDCVSNEMANRIALFYAHATPMLKMLSDTTARFVSQHKDLPVENTTDCLSAMANICRFMIEHEEYISRFNKEETKWFCLRVMVGVIILYDHVHFVGAFAKSSSIDMKSSIKLLKDQQPSRVEGLLNALRYTTKHLNDETTPKSVKALLAE